MVNCIFWVYFCNLKIVVIGFDLLYCCNLVKGLLCVLLVCQVISEECESEWIFQEKVEGIVLCYVNEIVLDFFYLVICFFEVIFSWFWNKLYEGVKVNYIEWVQDVVQGNEIVYVFCYCSYIDYLLFFYLLFCNGLILLYIVVGINLNMLVIGLILCCGGVFFMCCSFKGNQFYIVVFNEYLYILFFCGFFIEYFVEGGCLCIGCMFYLCIGMFVIILCSFFCDLCWLIVFVLVYIGYECVLEGCIYFGELCGVIKKKELIFDLFKVVGVLKQCFGQVWVNFGELIYFDQFFDCYQFDWQDQDFGLEYCFDWLLQIINLLVKDVVCYFNDVVVINLVNLVVLVLFFISCQVFDESVLV